MKLIFIALICSLPCIGTFAQEADNLQYYVVPSEMALVLIGSRANSDLTIEKVFAYTNGKANRIICSYQLRNVGKRRIKSVGISIITNFLFLPKGGGRLEVYEDSLGFARSKNSQSFLIPNASAKIGGPKISPLPNLPEETISLITMRKSELKTPFIVAVVISYIEFENGEVKRMTSDTEDVHRLFLDGVDVR